MKTLQFDGINVQTHVLYARGQAIPEHPGAATQIEDPRTRRNKRQTVSEQRLCMGQSKQRLNLVVDPWMRCDAMQNPFEHDITYRVRQAKLTYVRGHSARICAG